MKWQTEITAGTMDKKNKKLNKMGTQDVCGLSTEMRLSE